MKNFKQSDTGNAGLTPQTFEQAALDFERSKNQELKFSRKVAWFVAGSAMGLAIVSSVAGAIAVFKRPEPIPTIITLDKGTGVSSVVRNVADAHDKFDEVVDKHWLSEYVRFREGYDWYEISGSYDVVKLLSSNDVSSEYESEIKAPNSALNVLKDNGKIRIKVGSVSFVGDMAQVRYTSEKTNASGHNLDGSPVQNFVATVSYTYDVESSMTEQERMISPMGFKVLSYRRDAEVASQ